jgi:hypothetical protein
MSQSLTKRKIGSRYSARQHAVSELAQVQEEKDDG